MEQDLNFQKLATKYHKYHGTILVKNIHRVVWMYEGINIFWKSKSIYAYIQTAQRQRGLCVYFFKLRCTLVNSPFACQSAQC